MKAKTANRKKEKPVITSGMFSSRTNEWATPQQFFDTLDAEFGFDLDVAATPENAKCERFFTEKKDGLKQDWCRQSKTKTVFCNPPFGGQTGLWLEKAYSESQKGCTVVVVIPFRSDTSYLHDFAFNKASEIRLVRGRLKYNDGKNTSPFPTAVIIYKPGKHSTRWTAIDKEGEELGAIVKIKPELTYSTNRVYKNGKKAPDGIEIRFGDTRPTEEVRKILKANGFKFSDKQKMWYAVSTPETKAFAEEFASKDIEADDTQYEKRSFWAKIKSHREYEKLFNRTEFFVKGEPPKYYYSKSFLEKAFSVKSLINEELLYFKKYYNKIVGEEGEESEAENEENENEENEKAEDSRKPDFEIAEKLKSIADGMQNQINAKLNSAISRQRQTARRARIAAGMRQEGYYLQEIQHFLYALSDAHKKGTINNYPYLKSIRNKLQAEQVNKYAHGKKDGWNLENYFQSHKESLEKLGIRSAYEWSIADVQKGELIQKHSPAQVRRETENERKIKELEMEILSRKIPGFFPTPKNLIEQLIELADIKSSDKILEPSAGKGDILDTIKAYYPDADLSAAEVNSTLREILTLKGHKLIGTDFLEIKTEKFDRIIMNPPFENGQDAEHVSHALSLLKSGGRVVAIMSEGVFFRQFKKDQAFRELLFDKNAFISEPIKDAFKNAFKSTGVAVRIVAINEDGSPISYSEREDEFPDSTSEETEDLELLELEAEAELELLKMRVELEKKKSGANGLEGINPAKLQRLKQRAWELQDKWDVLNFK